MERNLTAGSLVRNMAAFSLPYLLSYLMQTLYGMADLFIMGQFGSIADITSVSVGSQFMHFVTVVLVGLAVGSTVCIAQSVGAGDREKSSLYVGNTVSVFIVVALVMMAILLLLVRWIVGAVSTPAEAFEGTVAYLKICFLGIPFITAYNIIAAVFRGIGDSKSPMYFIAVACVLNVALDYLFIGAFNMGAAGAALATVVSQSVSVVVAVIYISLIGRRESGSSVFSGGIVNFIPKKDVVRRICGIGIPVALQDGFIQIAFLFVTAIANQRGLVDAAAVGIVEKIICLVFLVPSSMLSTVSAVAAQNIGAERWDRAKAALRYALITVLGYGLVIGISFQFCSEQVVGLFMGTDDVPTRIAGGQYLRSYIWDAALAGGHFCFSGYFCACGRSVYSFIHNVISIVIVRVPGSYILSHAYPETLYPMGCAIPAGSFLSVVVCVAFYIVIEKKLKLTAQNE